MGKLVGLGGIANLQYVARGDQSLFFQNSQEGFVMLRNISVCTFALAAVLLFSSDASACCRGCGSRCGYYGISSGCGGCCGNGGYGYSSYGYRSYGYRSYGYGGYGYGGGAYGYGGYRYAGYGRYGYNPGGIGGPASGLGVRPGVGFGGFGPGR
jgi:hypothetical protein